MDDTKSDNPDVLEADPKEQKPADLTSPATSTFGKRRWFRAEYLILGIVVLVIAIAQFLAADSDHQNANLVTLCALAVGLITLVFGLYQRLRRFHAAIVPTIVFISLGSAITAFKFDGFNGEMMPQFKWRFAKSDHAPLQTVPILDASAEQPNSQDDDKPADQRESGPSSNTSTQFLGNHRNGVIPERDFAIPTSTGEVQTLWDIRVGPAWSSFAVQDGVAVTLEQREDRESLTAYRLSDGKLLWICQHVGRHHNMLGGVGPRSTPTIFNSKVFANTATGHVWCVDLKSGKEIWNADLLRIAGWTQADFETSIAWGHAASPLLVDDLCILTLGGADTSENRSLIAFDANLWV